MEKFYIETNNGHITNIKDLEKLTDEEIIELLKALNKNVVPIIHTSKSIVVKKLAKSILEELKPTHLTIYIKAFAPENQV
jgi:hypothetical protein